MAIRPLSTIDVDSSKLEFKSLGTGPKNDYETGVQQRDKTSNSPLWTFDVLVTIADGTTATASVTVPAQTLPSIPLLAPLTFVGLRASTFGSAGLLLRADSITPVRVSNAGRGE